MKYDDASWHSDGGFPADQPQEHGGTHIALFLKWCFVRGWAGDLHLEEEPDATRRVIAGELSATDFLFKYCDGKFTDEDISEFGQKFVEQYYGDEGLYLKDYSEHFGELMYIAPESAHDFKKFSAMIEQRLEGGPLTEKRAPVLAGDERRVITKMPAKPWWKLW